MSDQKCALITGASSGIGKEFTYLFARDGYSLILSALNHKKVEGFGMQVSEEYKIPVEIISADLAKSDGARQLYDEVKKRGKSIDVLVNNAGIGMYGDFVDVDMEEYLNIINVNIISFTHIAKLFVPEIIERKGKILNTASISSYQPGPHMSVYYASKAYNLSMSLALSEELEKYGVTVTALCPGPTVTNFQKRAKQEKTRAYRNRLLTMQPKEVAEIGYEAMNNGKRVVIAGTKNKVTMAMERFMSQKAVTKLSQLYLTVTGKDAKDKEKELELHSRAGEVIEELEAREHERRQEMGSQIKAKVDEHFEERRVPGEPRETPEWTPADRNISRQSRESQGRESVESQIEEEFQADMQIDESIEDMGDAMETALPEDLAEAERKQREGGSEEEDRDRDRRREMEANIESQVDEHIGEGMKHSEPIRHKEESGDQNKSERRAKGESKTSGISEEKNKGKTPRG